MIPWNLYKFELILHSSIMSIYKSRNFAGRQNGWGSDGIGVSACGKSRFVTSSAGKTGAGCLPLFVGRTLNKHKNFHDQTIVIAITNVGTFYFVITIFIFCIHWFLTKDDDCTEFISFYFLHSMVAWETALRPSDLYIEKNSCRYLKGLWA